jgi:hypothetical protein
MGAAEIISFEEIRARKQWDLLRQQLHERFDQWIDTLEQQWPEPPSTFPEVTAMVWDVRQQLTGGITESVSKKVGIGFICCDSLAVCKPENPTQPIFMIPNGRFSNH